MRLGIGSYTYPFHVMTGALDHIGLVEHAAELGAEVVQFCENLSLFCLAERELCSLVERACGLDIRLEVGARGLDEQNLARHAEMSMRLGASFFRVVIDDGTYEPSVTEATERLSRFLASRPGIRVAIENHDRFRCRDLRSIVEQIGPDRIGITLDTANSLGCLEGIREVLDSLGPYTLCLHVKDVRARRLPTMLGFTVTGTQAGLGGLDIPAILSRMPKACESCILEQWPHQLPGEEPPLVTEREDAEKGFAFLRQALDRLPSGERQGGQKRWTD